MTPSTSRVLDHIKCPSITFAKPISHCWFARHCLTQITVVDRGLLDYDTPIAHYWPEFAQHGKGNVTVAQLMRHQAALATPSQPITLDDIGDPDQLARVLAAQVSICGELMCSPPAPQECAYGCIWVWVGVYVVWMCMDACYCSGVGLCVCACVPLSASSCVCGTDR